MDPRYRGLGRRQRQLLARLRALHAEYLAATIYVGLRSRARSYGVVFKVGGSGTRRSVASRALIALERRGLIVRRLGPRGRKQVSVWLPPDVAAGS